MYIIAIIIFVRNIITVITCTGTPSHSESLGKSNNKVVLDDVPLHVALLGGAVGAVGAGKGLLPRVGADVGTDALHLHRREVTVGAGKRLLLGVDA